MKASATLSTTAPERAESLGALLRRPYARLQARVYQSLAASGFPEIRPAHSAVFRHIVPEGSRLVDLADLAGMTKQSMAAQVEHLAEHGYVSVAPDPEDGRAKRVKLTARGKRFVAAALAASKALEDLLADRLGASAVRDLRRLLGDIDQVLAE